MAHNNEFTSVPYALKRSYESNNGRSILSELLGQTQTDDYTKDIDDAMYNDFSPLGREAFPSLSYQQGSLFDSGPIPPLNLLLTESLETTQEEPTDQIQRSPLDILNSHKRSRELYELENTLAPEYTDDSTNETQNDASSPIITPQFEDMFVLVSSFLVDDGVSKVSGGKDNREPLPRQTLRVNLQLIPEEHLPSSNLLVKASLMGFTKHQAPKIVVDDVGRIFVSQVELDGDTVDLSFDNIIVTQSSHNHGQKLFIRFSLVNITNQIIICQVDSKCFQTITRRGKQKQKERKKKQISTPPGSPFMTSHLSRVNLMHERINTYPSKVPPIMIRPRELLIHEIPTITLLEPTFSSCRGGQLIKIHIKGATQYAKSIPIVLFDRDPCRRVLAFDGHSILCETPAKPAGFCTISVSFDNLRTFIGNSAIGVNYIDDPIIPTENRFQRDTEFAFGALNADSINDNSQPVITSNLLAVPSPRRKHTRTNSSTVMNELLRSW